MPLNAEELEKQIKGLGEQLVTLREELKALQAAPKPDFSDVSAVKTELEMIKKRLDDLKNLKDSGKDNDLPPPAPVPSPGKRRRGFGFFGYE